MVYWSPVGCQSAFLNQCDARRWCVPVLAVVGAQIDHRLSKAARRLVNHFLPSGLLGPGPVGETGFSIIGCLTWTYILYLWPMGVGSRPCGSVAVRGLRVGHCHHAGEDCTRLLTPLTKLTSDPSFISVQVMVYSASDNLSTSLGE